MKKILFAFVAVVAFVSCSKNDSAVESPSIPIMTGQKFICIRPFRPDVRQSTQSTIVFDSESKLTMVHRFFTESGDTARPSVTRIHDYEYKTGGFIYAKFEGLSDEYYLHNGDTLIRFEVEDGDTVKYPYPFTRFD